MKSRFGFMILGFCFAFGMAATTSAGVSFIWYLISEGKGYGELFGYSVLGYFCVIGFYSIVKNALRAANDVADEQGLK